MSLRRTSTKDLQEELFRREQAQRAKQQAAFEAWAAEHPCPYCQAFPNEVSTNAIREHRMAPCDDEGRAMLYAPPEMGATVALDYERTASCLNGHTWLVDETTKWLEKPVSGPRMLG